MTDDTAERIAKALNDTVGDRIWSQRPAWARRIDVERVQRLLATGVILPGPNLPPLSEPVDSEEQGR